MKTPLTTIIAMILHLFLKDENSISFFLAKGCGPDSFPDYQPFDELAVLAKSFIAQNELGHQSARVIYREQINKYMMQFGLDPTAYPPNKDEVVVRFKAALKTELANKCATRILSNPELADEIIEQFQSKKAPELAWEDIQTMTKQAAEELDIALGEGKTPIQVINGWELLSGMIGGFNPGRFSILFADTGFGKTNIGLQLAMASAETNPTRYFNMEMVKGDFANRAIVARSGMTYKNYYSSGASQEDIARFFGGMKLKATGGSDLSTDQVVGAIINEATVHGVKFFVVDYDQKLILSEDERLPEWKQLQRAAVQLENAAKKTGSYILLLAQSNFEGGISGSKRIAFGAYTVMRFYHHEESGKDIIECIKNRGGISGACLEVEYKRDSATIREHMQFQKPKKQKRELSYV